MTKRKALEVLEKRYYEKEMTNEEQDTLETKDFFFFVVGLYGMEVAKSEEKKIGKSADAFLLVQHALNSKKKLTPHTVFLIIFYRMWGGVVVPIF